MKNKAFTLIELLVVIAIISLLSSIVFASLSSAREKAQDAHRVAEAKEVEKAIELHRLDNNFAVPGALSGLKGALYTEDTPEYEQLMNELVTGGYIPAIPESPSGTDYAYIVSTDGMSAMFYSNQSDSSSTGDVCIRVGDNTFGATGTGTSCAGSIASSGSGVTYCGLPPYVASISSETYYAPLDSWDRTVTAVDPEGADVIMDVYSTLQMYYGGGDVECGGTSGLNQSTLSCSSYGAGPGTVVFLSFDYYTDGCPVETVEFIEFNLGT